MFKKKEVLKETKVKELKKEKKGPGIIKIFLMPLAVTLIIVAAIYLVMNRMTEKDALLKDVVVASKDIRVNAYIEPGDVDDCFKVIKVSGEAVTDTAYTSLIELKEKGFYTNHEIGTGEILYAGSIKTTDARLDKYKSGYEVTSISVSNFDKGVNGKLREGAIIDIYAVDPATDELTLFAEDVYVAASFDSSGNELTTDEGVAVSYTIYVKESEIESLNKAINYGEIHIYKK